MEDGDLDDLDDTDDMRHGGGHRPGRPDGGRLGASDWLARRWHGVRGRMLEQHARSQSAGAAKPRQPVWPRALAQLGQEQRALHPAVICQHEGQRVPAEPVGAASAHRLRCRERGRSARCERARRQFHSGSARRTLDQPAQADPSVCCNAATTAAPRPRTAGLHWRRARNATLGSAFAGGRTRIAQQQHNRG
jgi:hypothetical protein